MSWTNLRTNFKNLVWSGLRKYIKFDNPDQTVSFEDVTEYMDTENTQMTAEELNQMTDAINQIMGGDLFYTEDEMDTLLAGKANATHNHDTVYVKLAKTAREFSTSNNYVIGDIVYRNADFFRFIVDHPAGAWNGNHVEAIQVIFDEIKKKANTADLGDLANKDKVDYENDIDNIPSTFPPSTHNHNDIYYQKSEVNNSLISPLFYGYCTTEGNVAAKTVQISGFTLQEGSVVVVRFQNANTVDDPTLNINNTGAKPIYRYGTTPVGTNNTTDGWPSNSVHLLIYDGVGWIRHFQYNTTYTITTVSCTTSASTAAKTASCSYYYAEKPQYFQIVFRYTNSYEGEITLNINSSGAKPVYINGQPSSATNYTILRGIYIAYYDGENYYLDTTGQIPDVPKVYISYANETLWVCHNKVKTINIYNQNMSNIVGKSVSWSRGMDYQFILEVLPNDANPNVVWASSDETAMTIDQTGYCTALVKNVPSVISATAMDGSGVVASFTMTFK